MHVNGGSAQGFGKANCELPEAVQTHMAAKTNDGRLAGVAGGGHSRQLGSRGLPGVLENPSGDSLFGAAQFWQALFNEV